MITAKLGVGPLSTEIIEATYRFSEDNQKQMMLIASLNQINVAGGYVYGWKTHEFATYCAGMKLQYPGANVLLCRDHAGPGFMSGTPDLKAVYTNLRADCDEGFDLIHIDMCHTIQPGEVLSEVQNAMGLCLKYNPDMRFEVGTDAIDGELTDVAGLEASILQLRGYPIEFWVVNTGSLVRGVAQVGHFAIFNSLRCTKLLHRYGIKAKEHNSDYLTISQIEQRVKLGIDAMNVAPQFGVLQTDVLRQKGVDTNTLAGWEAEVRAGGHWKKWTDKEEEQVRCGGHYHFSGERYGQLFELLKYPYEDFIKVATTIMDRYNIEEVI